MTLQERQAVYTELGTLFVELDNAPEKGLPYVRERLTFCRAAQDRVGELLLRVNRAYAEACEARIRTEQLFVIDPVAVSKGQIAELKVEEAAHKMLVSMIKSHASLLSRTGADIRLLADITKEQLKRGEIEPPKEMIQQVEPADALPAVRNAGLGYENSAARPEPAGETQVNVLTDPAVTALVASMQAGEGPFVDEADRQQFLFHAEGAAEAAANTPMHAGGVVTVTPGDALADFSAALASTPAPGISTPAAVQTQGSLAGVTPPAVSFVNMGNDPTSPEPHEPMRLPDTTAVSFDDLFSQEPVYGSTGSHSRPL